MKSAFVFIAIFFLAGCLSSRQVKLSRFSFNGHTQNSLIVNRVPDYGINGRDGCVVEGQFFLSLMSTLDSKIHGTLKDSKTLASLVGAHIVIYFSGYVDPVQLFTNGNGEFSLTQKAPITKIVVNSIGWRTLVVDLGQRKVVLDQLNPKDSSYP